MLYFRSLIMLFALSVLLSLAACGGGSSSAPEDSHVSPTAPTTQSDEIAKMAPLAVAMVPIDEDAWDRVAVRRVLRTFALGGHATDTQIATWADRSPQQAIVEMLTFEQHNLKLSPPATSDHDGLAQRDGTLRGLMTFWSSDDPQNGTPVGKRGRYRTHPQWVWLKAATSRGLNPFRQKIGLWETNYHLVASEDDAKADQIIRYFDDIMEAHRRGVPYEEVLSIAATSAAIATQYGHNKNVYVNGVCRCNEDFAREYFQLFFGILGDPAPEYHETVTVPNMAFALTDMAIVSDSAENYNDKVSFGTTKHYPGVLEIMQLPNVGSDARERINQLSKYAIENQESIDNLPVIIISQLADDNLTPDKIAAIRAGWNSMPQKNLLTFLRAYAISTVFHREDRVKYWNSIERNILLANQIALNNTEADLSVYAPHWFMYEGVQIFRPERGVFGGQTGPQASETSDVFKKNYDSVTAEAIRYARAEGSFDGHAWVRDLSVVVPANTAGKFVVSEVGRWLWERLVGDGLKNFGPLEQAYVFALLATGEDLGYMLDTSYPERVIDATDLISDPVKGRVAELATSTISVNSKDPEKRKEAAFRIGQAVNFIVGTPYIFVDRGR